jgi:hypothetical protein
MINKEATTLRRSIPDDYTYNAKKLKHLKAILHNVSVALGTLSSAHQEMSRIKGPEISPDGLLGGVGYIIPLQEIKQTLNSSIHGLSNVADCIADELTNPRWNVEDDKEVKELIKEKEKATDKIDDTIEDPEGQDSEENITPHDIVTVEELQEKVTPKKASIDPLSMAIIQKLSGKQSKRSTI